MKYLLIILLSIAGIGIFMIFIGLYDEDTNINDNYENNRR